MLSRGDYQFKLRACHRDREQGDSCSLNSQWMPASPYAHKDTNVRNIDPNQQLVADLKWGEILPQNSGDPSLWALEWVYIGSPTNKPDYFLIKGDDGGNCSSTDHNRLTVEFIKNNKEHADTNRFTSRFVCNSLEGPSSGLHIADFYVQSCYYGEGCTKFDENLTPHLSASEKGNPAYTITRQPIQTRNNSVVGGPGDLNPGIWANSWLDSTGWHFYWASDLRYPNTHPDYDTTYDLIGVWFAYKIINEVWTPVWIYSQLKLEQGCSVNPQSGGQCDSDQFFQGDLLYLSKDMATGTIEVKENIGRLQVHFDRSTTNTNGPYASNSRVLLNIDLEANQGVFTQISNIAQIPVCSLQNVWEDDTNCMRVEGDGSLTMPIEDIERLLDPDPLNTK